MPDTTIQTILQLDADDNREGLLSFIQEGPKDHFAILSAAYHLLSRNRLQSAYVLAMFLANQGYQHQLIALTLAIGGVVYDNADEERRGMANLATLADQLTPEQQENTYRQIVIPVMTPLLTEAVKHGNATTAMRLLAILRADVPFLRTIFDPHAPLSPTFLDDMRQRGQARFAPLSLPLPGPDTPRRPRCAVVAFRPGGPRDHHLLVHDGVRLVEAMQVYGWQATLLPLRPQALAGDRMPLFQEIVSVCRAQRADILLLDDALLLDSRQLRTAMIDQLRAENPELRVVGCHPDPWVGDAQPLRDSAARLDALWSVDDPDAPAWRHPELSGKTLFMPMPTMRQGEVLGEPLGPRMLLVGEPLDAQNWLHMGWVCAAEDLGVPIKRNLASYRADLLGELTRRGQSVITLSDASCHVRFTLRGDQSRTITRHAFDSLASGALLIQESSPQMDRRFMAGEHYLEFANLAELAALARFVTERPQEAEAIRQRGHAFAMAHYGNDRLMGGLDRRLFGPGHRPVVAPPADQAALLSVNPDGSVTPLFAVLPPPQPVSEPPAIMLTICIPTYNRHLLLAHTLDSLQWTLEAGVPIEIIVSDNASDDATGEAARAKGALFPWFRYVRQSRNLTQPTHWISAMRLARGRYSIALSDDDYILPQALLAELELLESHPELIASYASPLMWNDATGTDHGNTYGIDAPRIYRREDSVELFNFFMDRRVIPEFAVYRTLEYSPMLFESPTVYPCFIWPLQALRYGQIRFHDNTLYRVVLYTPLKTPAANLTNVGLVQVTSLTDQYRAGIELAVAQALANVGLEEFTPGNRPVMLDVINDFVIGRISVASRVAQQQGNYTGAVEFLKRWSLWVKHDADRELIRKADHEVVGGAVVQTLERLCQIVTGTRRVVLCEVPHVEYWLGHFTRVAPQLSVEARALTEAASAADRGEALYLTDQAEGRATLLQAGVEAGRILLLSDLVLMLRVRK
ncbi:MAG: glycosyltransferase [Magnetococcales bacterium]|nr:glycosyltransferase [Magnetococcales bacterium]